MLLKRCSPQDAFRRSRPIAVGVNDAELARPTHGGLATDFREILNDAIKAKT